MRYWRKCRIVRGFMLSLQEIFALCPVRNWCLSRSVHVCTKLSTMTLTSSKLINTAAFCNSVVPLICVMSRPCPFHELVIPNQAKKLDLVG